MEAGRDRAQAAAHTPPSGILLVDKPGGITSHDVVSRARRALGTRKVGHAGTLDPMATGLLILGVGASTRLLTWIVGADKTYEATIRLGAASSTDDAEGQLGPEASATALGEATDERISAGVAALTGELLQRPSSVSAIKVDGKRAYARVREGEDVVLEPRSVTVSRFEVLGIERGSRATDVRAVVECSSGTYIRALARDLGEALGVGGHLTALRRTRIGPFEVAGAVRLEDDLPAALMDAAAAASRLFPVVVLDADQTRDLAHGKRVRIDAADGAPVGALSPDGRLLGLVDLSGGVARVLVNFPPEASS
ncbi:tRNA pseudouridine(55) synthase TruB [Salinibacterium soli]|uniref:tRNA pseudouridine synthase B n=1 Tax=Antiquaquibacter soli TaxID=3064523 RepID=A0ABT9BMF2_9MICO|nr:tRNA pseudouridine(55) synthase TruB [Protaetiibacter sp. WY-16]MDO7881602.1 tRNA pseudouridine(55) synthase TruB [Protaetiibacter sp. WY-16]